MRNHISKVRQSKLARRRTGSALFVMVAVICLVIVPLIILSSQIGLMAVDRARVQSVIEAAGLLAANDCSRIVINDPNFGYVSLSNYAPVGRGTIAGDGEPLPVVGINTLVGTIRQNAIIAKELNNHRMAQLAETDRADSLRTIDTLNRTLSEALSGTAKDSFYDMSGAKVDPLKDVKAFLKVNLPVNVEVGSITLTNGWVKDGARTTIPVSKPESMAQVKPNEIQQGFYKPFITLAAAGQPYTFAGLGQTSTIIQAKNFQPADREHINSIVKIDCVLKVHRPGGPLAIGNLQIMPVIACCQPYSLPDVGPGGVMSLRFTGGPVTGLQSWSDFLNDGTFKDRQVNCYDVVGGDFQMDREARKRLLMPLFDNTTAHQFSENLYYWLRSGHLRPRMNAVFDMIGEQFKMGPMDMYAYEFANDGSISRRIVDKDPFPIGVTSDAQFSTLADTYIQGDKSPVIIFRNNVRRLGTMNGGKHAGQPLAGVPANWCELSEYGGGEQLAAKLGRGKLGTGLVMDDPNYQNPNHGLTMPNIFRTLSGQTAQQPRTSFYSGGLALDIEIGGTKPSTAFIDVERMRKLKR